MPDHPDPKGLRPSSSNHFRVEDGWMECPSLFQIEGARIGWHWHPEREMYGLEVTSLRSFPGIGPVTVHVMGTPEQAHQEQPQLKAFIQEQFHQTVALRAME